MAERVGYWEKGTANPGESRWEKEGTNRREEVLYNETGALGVELCY